ncbi:MAG: hypothetical protein V4457_05920 [Pseudomonadota bacterium]
MDHVKKFLALLLLSTAASAFPNVYDKSDVPPGQVIYAKAYGVKANGTTSDDVALKRAADACNTAGGHLVLPPGTILLDGTGTTHIALNGCWMQGSGGNAADSHGSNGTQFNLTSLTVVPFYLEHNFKVSDVNFYWPNQADGVTAYPALFTDGTTANTQMNHGVIDNITIINAYDGLKITTGLGTGDVKISNSTMWALHDLFSIHATGDSWTLSNNRFTPGPWLNLVNFSAGVKAAIDAGVVAGNKLIHATAGAITTLDIDGETFDWSYFIYVDSGGSFGQAHINVNQDGIGTIVDSSSGGVYAVQSKMQGIMSTCQIWSYVTSTGSGHRPCFNLGAGSGLDLADFALNASRGDIIDITGGGPNYILLNNVSIGQIGSAADGGDYYFIYDPSSTSQLLRLTNSRVIGNASGVDAHCCHGILYPATAFGTPNFLMKNNLFSFMTDILTVNSNQTLLIEGNSSFNTYASGYTLNVLGNGKAKYEANYWDIDPIQAPVPNSTAPDSKTYWNWGLPVGVPPSGFFANNGVYVVGQAPSSSATATFGATSGSTTVTFSAATLLNTAADIGRVVTVLDTTYKYCTITANTSTTVATCTISGGTLSGTGPFANNAVWLSGTPTTNTTAFSVPFSTVYSAAYMYFPASAIVSGQTAGIYYATCTSTTVCTVYNNALVPTPSIASVTITGTAGQFGCTCYGLTVGQSIAITGTYGGTGSIASYASGLVYYVSATDGLSTFTLQATPGVALATTAGTPTGLTYTAAGSPRPVSIASPRVWSTTGPGAFTQAVTSQNLLTMRIPPFSLGPQGSLVLDVYGVRPSNADVVVFSCAYGTIVCGQLSAASVLWYGMHRTVRNVGSNTSQVTMATANSTGSDATTLNTTPVYGTVDTTLSQNFVLKGQVQTATDWFFILSGSVAVTYGGAN